MNENLKSALEQVGIDLVKELTKQLLNADKKASGNLIKSLDYKVVETVDGFILNLLAADYLNTVDQGPGGGTNYFLQNTLPVNPSIGDRWYNTSTGVESVYIYDGFSFQWIAPASSGPAGATGGEYKVHKKNKI